MPGLEPTRNSALKIAVVCFPTEPRHLAHKKLMDVCPVIGAILSDLKTSDTFTLHLIQEKVQHLSSMKNS